MSTDKKFEVVVNLLPVILSVVPTLVTGGKKALDLYNKLVEALKDGITPEELNAAIIERDLLLQQLLDETEVSA